MFLYHLFISAAILMILSACGNDTISETTEDDFWEDPFSSAESSSSALSSSLSAKSSSSLSPADSHVGSSVQEDVSTRLEIPKLKGDNFFAPHWVDCGGQRIMNFALEWNAKLRHATWVAFRWDSLTSVENTSRGGNWQWDPEIPLDQGAVSESDHKNDGFDKGHIMASSDRLYCEDANEQTFYYSNISPQMSTFNQGFWETLESKVRSWGRRTSQGSLDTVYVVKGANLNNLLIDFTGLVAGNDGIIPVVDSEGLSPKGLAVPAYYYMALLTVKNGMYNSIGFYVPHSEDLPKNPEIVDLQKYAVTIDELEAYVDVDFFHNLPDAVEKDVESVVDLDSWNW